VGFTYIFSEIFRRVDRRQQMINMLYSHSSFL
jgi:hypothetical protein